MPPAETTQPQPGSPLLEMVLAFLTPLFLQAAGRDAKLARKAAQQAISGLESLPPADLLAHAQTIALTASAMASLAQATAPDLPPALVIRLRANGHALARSAERNRRTQMQKGQKSAPAASPVPATAASAPRAAWADAFAAVAQDFTSNRSGPDAARHDTLVRAALANAALALGSKPQHRQA